jgi:putative ABC transport system substrate-binding protein
MTRKITLLTLCAMLFALTVPAQAQQPKKVARIGFLFGLSPSASTDRAEAFREGLRELGYIEGKNIIIESRYAEGKLDRLSASPLARHQPVLPRKRRR